MRTNVAQIALYKERIPAFVPDQRAGVLRFFILYDIRQNNIEAAARERYADRSTDASPAACYQCGRGLSH
ncbi:hypothetical protein GCM10011400_67220 [Paraburkholderia caffeinilytica]|uniref:Uncharacterized protein n=1 Tax=Paraburkholderia caffeinilytica TaxID=1761016 RepID=A0ABQ1NC73_9BURK|nr:hypothetical protein GCM10011400_67220 [Paraburkholderia caffeinilytica]